MRVAIVCYYSPPQPAIASHRVLRMSRALLAAGHQVHWVTADTSRFDPDVLDSSLGSLVPDEVRVHHLGGRALITKPVAANPWEKVLRTLAWHMPRHFAWPDSFISWARTLRRRLPGLLSRNSIEAVVLCCSPHNQILVLPGLRRALPDLQIFVDYRDLLSGNPWNPRSSSKQAARILTLERRVLASADALFVNTGAAREKFVEVVGAVGHLAVEVVRNAADYDLADQIEAMVEEPDLGPGVHLGFFGTLFPRRRLRPLLDAMASLPPADRDRVVLHVYCDALDSAAILEEDLAAVPVVRDRVERHGYLGYISALRAMQAMDALVLVNGPEADDAVFVPGKLYDYLMARRPVVFVGHPGDARQVVERTSGAGWCFGPTDIEGLRGCLERILSEHPARLSKSLEDGPERSFAPLLNRLA